MSVTVDSIEELQAALAKSRSDIQGADRSKLIRLLWDMIDVRLDYLVQLPKLRHKVLVPVLLDGWDEMDRLIERRMNGICRVVHP